jgi:hypothetical protein
MWQKPKRPKRGWPKLDSVGEKLVRARQRNGYTHAAGSLRCVRIDAVLVRLGIPTRWGLRGQTKLNPMGGGHL